MLQEILTKAGIRQENQVPNVYKGNEMLNASGRLFGFVLGEKDSRWGIVRQYVEGKHDTRFRGIHFETAMQAIYLSNQPSFRNQYASYPNAQNIRQLARSVVNLGAWNSLAQSFRETEGESEVAGGLGVSLARTNKLTLGTDGLDITGCPEALYQLRLFSAKGDYMGRVGFNFHTEESGGVLSITNIQGVPGGAGLYNNYTEMIGHSPFNSLVRRVKSVAQNLSYPEQADIEVRGLRNPKHKPSAPLYNTVLKREKVKRVRFKRNLRS